MHFCRSLKSNTSEPQTTTSVEGQTTSIKGQTTIDVGSSEKDFMTTVSNVAEVPNRNSEPCPCPYSGYITTFFLLRGIFHSQNSTSSLVFYEKKKTG